MGFWSTVRSLNNPPEVPLPRVAVARPYTRSQLSDGPPKSGQAWQMEAWRIWEGLGEIHYPTTQISRLVSRLDWNVFEPEYDSDGERVPAEDFDLEEEFADPGLAEIARTSALNLIVAGEGWLTWQGDTWNVFSVAEPNLNSTLEGQDGRVRVWTPDPRNNNSADSGVRAAIAPGSELLALQNLSLAQIHSRAASAGILLRPSTRTPLVDEEGNPVDFTEMLHESMTAAIQDTSSVAAVAPIDLELPADEIEYWTHLQFTRPYDDRIDMRMERVIRRIALALDIWPELLLGVADINHWGSWFLSEDTWRSTTAPLANQVAQMFEEAIYEKLDRRVVIEPDPAVLLARRSSVRDALNAAWIGGVGLKYIREVIGAEEKDAPTDEELDIIRLMAGQRRSETRAGIIAGEEEEITPAADGSQDPVLGAAGDVLEGLGVELVRLDDQMSAWVEGAAETTIENVRAQVGVRLRRALRGNPKAVELDGVPNDKCAAVFGEGVFELVDVDQIVRTGIAPLVDRWDTKIASQAKRILEVTGPLGIPDGDWDTARKRSTEILEQILLHHIVSTLTMQSVPFVDLRGVVSAAGVD